MTMRLGERATGEIRPKYGVASGSSGEKQPPCAAVASAKRPEPAVSRQELAPGAGAWEAHAGQRLLLLHGGALSVESDDAQWYLFAGHAGWIDAGVRHRVSTQAGASVTVIRLAPATVSAGVAKCAVFRAPPLLAEMASYAHRWHAHSGTDGCSARFMAALADVCARQVSSGDGFRLAHGRSMLVERSIAWALSDLGGSSVDEMARHAGVSPRTLTRRFRRETGLTAGRYMHTARMLRAMGMLAAPRSRVSEVAVAVGFDSLSAFSHAFREFAGESPRDFRAEQHAASNGMSSAWRASGR